MKQASRYPYLAQFVETDRSGLWFGRVAEEDIIEAEKRLGFSFPSQLREFYLEIGYGFLAMPENPPAGYDHPHVNRIIDPTSIADIVLLGEESEQIIPEVTFEEGEMPFFEIADGASFLVMHPQSAFPNRVYDELGKVIADDFEQFIRRLYFEDPTFYLGLLTV